MTLRAEICCLKQELRKVNNALTVLMQNLADNNSIIYITEDYTATDENSTIVGNTSADPIEVTLPDAASVEGQRYTFIRVPSLGEDLTITPVGSDTINGDTNFVLVNDWSSVTMRAAVDGWLITATYNT